MYRNTFYFTTYFESIIYEIHALNGANATPIDTIPIRIIKENSDILGLKVLRDFNLFVAFGMFPKNQNLGDFFLVLKLRIGMWKTIFAS